jgi:hypothetical protein
MLGANARLKRLDEPTEMKVWSIDDFTSEQIIFSKRKSQPSDFV